MSGINSGILQNASPLTAEQIKLIEQQAIEMNTTMVYLNEKGETCFTTPGSADSIKKLAWHNCSSLERAATATFRRDFKKTGLGTFKTTDFCCKSDDADSWISCYQEPLHITGNAGKIPSGFTIFHDTRGSNNYVPDVLYTGDPLPTLLPGDLIAHDLGYVSDNGRPATVVYAVLSSGGYNDLDGVRAAILTTLRADYIKDISYDLEQTALLPWTYFNEGLFGADSLDEFFAYFDEGIYGNQQLICQVIAIRGVIDTTPKLANSVFGLTVATFGLDSMVSSEPISYDPFDLILPNSVVDVTSTAFYGSAVNAVTTLREDTFVINSNSFNCSSIYRFSAPFGTTDVMHGAFSYSQLHDFHCPKGVSTVDSYAFAYTPIGSIKLSNDLRYISDCAFEGCYNLQSIELPSSLEAIDCSAFFNTSLRHITIPESVTYIGESVFSDCYQLESADIRAQLDIIPMQAFAYTPLRNVSLPSTLISIDGGAFAHTNISELRLPKTIQYIDNGAFFECASLQTVDFGSAKVIIYDDAFQGCTSLHSITSTENVNEIGYGAFGNSMIREATFGSNLQSIGQRAFEYAPLERLDISSSHVSFIGEGAFYATNLETIDLSSITSCYVDDRAFQDCDCLYTVTIGTDVDHLGQDIFFGCNSLGSINYLGTSEQWRNILANSNPDWANGSPIEYVQCSDGVVDLNGNPISLWVVPENCTYYQFVSQEENSIEYPAGSVVAAEPSLHDSFYDGELAYEYIDEDSAEIKAGWNICGYNSDISRYQIRTEINNAPVVSIGPGAFSGAEINSLIIPDSIVYLYDEAFADCTELSSPTFTGTVQQWRNIIARNPDWYEGSSIRLVRCSDGNLYPDGTGPAGSIAGGSND